MKIDLKKIKILLNTHGKALFVLVLLAVVVVMGAVYMPSVVNEVVSSGIHNREIPIYCVDTEEKKVALSFDAAWGNEDTETLLSILKKYDVHVTFFMTGGWIESYPDDVKAIAAAGHDLANHSENHKQMSKLSESECIEEIMKPHEKVKELTGVEMCLFRPPYGDYNDTLVNALTDCGYYAIQWSVDSLDWKDYGADNIVDTVLNHKNLDNGAIILMHNGAKFTKDALERIIVGLMDKGYEIVPISEIIYTEEYTIDGTGKQIAQ